MNSHALAKMLLSLPNLPVSITAMGHTYDSRLDKISHGPLKIGLLKKYSRYDRIIIGEYSNNTFNPPNERLEKTFFVEPSVDSEFENSFKRGYPIEDDYL
jgi:hypothetical protein